MSSDEPLTCEPWAVPTTVLQHPNPVLTTPVAPVERVEVDEILRVAPDLIQIMSEWKGCGLAFPQVGIAKAGFVYAPAGPGRDPQIIFNPTIERASRKNEPDRTFFEGCLSVDQGHPRTRVAVVRPHRVKVSYFLLDKWWRPKKARVDFVNGKELFDWDARVFQHEYDHLHGIELGGANIDDLVKFPRVLEHAFVGPKGDEALCTHRKPALEPGKIEDACGKTRKEH